MTTEIEDKYIIHEDQIMGKGAWSVVKKCSPVSPYFPEVCKDRPETKFVVKIIGKSYLISLTKGNIERAMAEVKREIAVLKHIPPHENVVKFIEKFENANYFFLVFEEIEAGDLCELILAADGGKLSEQVAKRYVFELVKAVLHCHTHDVIHRDIKPENLLVNSNNKIKLTDFGLAKISKSSNESSNGVISTISHHALASGILSDLSPEERAAVIKIAHPYEVVAKKKCVCSDIIGTPRYGAPEMFYSKFTDTHYDGFVADTWSVGIVAYIVLTGSFPFSAGSNASEKDTYKAIIDTTLRFPSGVSPVAADFVQLLLNKDPSKRVSLHEAIDHPWFEGLSEISPSGPPSRTVALKRLSLPIRDDVTPILLTRWQQC